MIRRIALRAALPALAVAIAGCSGTALVDAVTPRSGYSVTTDLPYDSSAGNRRKRLDLYRPAAESESGSAQAGSGGATIVFFYGGNWESGEKEQYRFVAQALAARGHTVVVPNYRLYPEVRYPAFLEDAAEAVAWARRQGPDHGTPPGPVVLMGHSAGAYIALMLAVDGRWLNRQGLDPARDVRAAVGLAGPYDFLPLQSDMLKDLFGPEETRPDTQPVNHVRPGVPPLLLATGNDDTTVYPRNSDNLAAAVRRAGGSAEVIRYEKLGHIGIVAAFARPLRWLAPVLEDVDRFLGGGRV